MVARQAHNLEVVGSSPTPPSTFETMVRSVNHVSSRERRKKILKKAKGYIGARKCVYTVAKNQVEKSKKYRHGHLRKKKGDFRSIQIVRIGAASRQFCGVNYSTAIHVLKEEMGENFNKKEIASIAAKGEEAFKQRFGNLIKNY